MVRQETAMTDRASSDIRPIEHAAAWHGDALHRSERWRRALSAVHLDEIRDATRAVIAAGHDWRWVTRERFPLHATAALLAEIGDELENGCGMLRLSGFPVGAFDDHALRIAWVGLGVHLGTLRRQNADGELLRSICDEGAGAAQRYGQMRDEDGVFLSSRARTASTGALRYHSDRCDVVALLCVRQAKAGGVNRIASSLAVHNAMIARRPDLAELLYQDIYRSRLGEEHGGEQMRYPLPVFGVRDGHFTSHYSRTFVEAAERMPGGHQLTCEQWQALDLLANLADELCLEMRLEPGEMQFLNNHVIYHSRTAFEDDERADAKRLLYRLWLSVPNSRPLPHDHAVLWGNVEAGALRGGIG